MMRPVGCRSKRPMWASTRHHIALGRCPLDVQQQTSAGCGRRSASGQKQTPTPVLIKMPSRRLTVSGKWSAS